MEKLKVWFLSHKITALLIVGLVVLGMLGWLGVKQFTSQPSSATQEIDLLFDAEGPYAQLFPRRDGNALILNLKRTASYDEISYELAYTSLAEEVAVEGGKVKRIGDEGESGSVGESGVIDRGVAGTIDTKDKKGEYEQEILFGTCSKNVCKYDKGVENGTLTLKIKKGNKRSLRSNDLKLYRMITQWHLQKPDVALGVLTSGDGHLNYIADADRQTLANIGFTIINDLTGVPKLPSGKIVLGKVYSLNPPITKDLPTGDVSLELAENPPSDAKLYRHNPSKSEWEELDTKIDGSKLSAKASGAGIFAVFAKKEI